MSLLAFETLPEHSLEARILIVDDQPLNVELTKRMLQLSGYRNLTGVTDPREVLERYSEFDPDLILLDLHMPHVDGFLLLRHLRAQAPPELFLPILVITGDWTSDARHRALACGASDFLTRPIDASEILLRVGNLLATRMLQLELARQNRGLEASVEARTAELRAANEQLQQEMKARVEAEEALRRHTDFVHLLDVITAASSQSAPVHQVFQVALEQVCASTGWQVGHALKRSPAGVLVSAGLWRLPEGDQFNGFRAQGDTFSFPTGVGLPGRVLASGLPAWIVDLSTDINFRRGRAASEFGLRSGFALPVLAGGEVGAVLEFFSTGNTPPSLEMLEVMQQVGAQLGRVLERQQAEQALRSSEAKFRSFAQLGSDGIILADSHGRIISWNHGAAEIFGYSEEEALGRSLQMLLPERNRPVAPGTANFLSDPALLRMVGRKIEIEGQRKSGAEFPMELALDVWTTWDGTFCSGVVRDATARKELEKSLRYSEERHRRLLEATKVIPWAFDVTRRVVTYVGPQIVSLLGYDREDWERPGFWVSQLHPEDRDWVIRHCEEAAERQEGMELEYRMLAVDGRVVWMLAVASAAESGHQGVSGFLLDISAQKEAQEAQRQLAAVVEFSQDAIIGVSLEGIITSWNKGAERLFRYARGEMLGRSGALLLPPDRAENLHTVLAEVARGERLESRDTVLLGKEGRRLDVSLTLSPIRDAHGRTTGICGIGRDVAERKRAEEELRRSHDRLEALVAARTAELSQANDQLRAEMGERVGIEAALRGSEQRMKTLLASAEEIVFEFDERGQYLSSWAGGEELLAQMNERRAGRSLPEMMGDWVGKKFPETVKRVLAEGRPETIEHTLQFAGGQRWFLSRIAPLPDPQGSGRSVCLMARDITERKQCEEDLRLAKDDAERANSAKTNFLSRMSHELRTPLNAILGFAQLIDCERLTEPDREGVEQIVNAGQHLLNLINEVLDMARIEVGRLTLSLEPLSACEVVAEAVALVRPLAAERGITLPEVECDFTVVADRQRLRQVLLNFLSNAIKYNRPSGSVAVSCSAVEGNLRIAITDTGPGIPAGKLVHLFKPFERLETHPASVEGIGLGLAISKRLIELMGGQVGASSQLNQGSTFWLTLPTTEEAIEMPQAEEAAENSKPSIEFKPCHVLYIEDNLSNLKLVERLLSRHPAIRLVAATSGQPGLELAIRHRPALILLDLHLPDMPGTEVLARLRSDCRTAGIPVIVTSADARAVNQFALRHGAVQGFLSKPLDVEQFTLTLKKVLVPAREALESAPASW